MIPRLFAKLLACMLLFSSPAWGADSTLALNSVLQHIFTNHPDIALSRIQQRNLAIEDSRIEGQLDPSLKLQTTVSDETSPTTNPFAASGTNRASATGSIVKPLQDGSSITASLSYNRTHLNYPSTVPSTFQSTINPTYQHQIDLIYRYPLLRGHGNPSYTEQLNANQHKQEAAAWSVAQQSEQLASQAIALYYQIAANEIAIDLARDAVQRSQRLLSYQKKREAFGLIEKADRLQAEALLATRQMEATNAQATLNSSISALNRLMLRDYHTPIHVPKYNDTLPSINSNLDALLKLAQQYRPIFHILNANDAANQANLAIATDQHDTQVDLIGQVGSRALSGSAGTAFGQGFTLNDRFISLGFEVSDVWGGKKTAATIAKAELEHERIGLQRFQTLEAIKTELSTALNDYHNGMMTKASAKLRRDAEQKKFTSEMKRYREGRSDTATVVQFEGDLRIAELQDALQNIQIELAATRLSLSTGQLLKSLGMYP